jgi:hypothetical protein
MTRSEKVHDMSASRLTSRALILIVYGMDVMSNPQPVPPEPQPLPPPGPVPDPPPDPGPTNPIPPPQPTD